VGKGGFVSTAKFEIKKKRRGGKGVKEEEQGWGDARQTSRGKHSKIYYKKVRKRCGPCMADPQGCCIDLGTGTGDNWRHGGDHKWRRVGKGITFRFVGSGYCKH